MTTPALMTAQQCGAIAHEVLGDDGEVRVIAVFERSIYVAAPRGIVCIGAAIGEGPINVEVARLPAGGWSDVGIATGTEGTASGRMLTLERMRLDVSAAAIWLPPPVPNFTPVTLRAGLAAMQAVKPPADGLARLVISRTPASTSVERAASGPIDALRRELPSVLASGTWSPDTIRAAILLTGLGPGLTPSGDDFLGGIMLALSATGHDGLRDALWAFLEPELDALTVPISAMHLSAAADGMGSLALHVLRDSILAGDVSGEAIADVAVIGHTSGWDAAAGIVLGLTAALP